MMGSTSREATKALPVVCVCCGGRSFTASAILWEELISAWELTRDEAAYIDLQQGFRCTTCHSNLRAMALARALLRAFRAPEPFAAFVESPAARSLRLLEINEADALTPFLQKLDGYCGARYPEVDMLALPYADGGFDVVCHSDTLEHVPRPVQALRECRRVLAAGGVLAYTVPIVVARLSRDRDELPPSWHGTEEATRDDFLVRTEYGADAWLQPLQAGFDACSIVSVAHPAAHAICAVRE